MSRLAGLLALALLAACAVGVEPVEPPARGAMVLITLNGLRADAIGATTPNLEAFRQEADWAGRAIAASSWGAPSLASLFTGLQPWSHQVLHYEQARLDPQLRTLAAALGEAGWRTAAYTAGRWFRGRHGFGHGFDSIAATGRGRRPAGHLASLEEERLFLWVDLPVPRAPYVRRDWLENRLGTDLPRGAPGRLKEADLLAYDFSPPGARDRLAAYYGLNVAHGDELVGRLLEALRTSGRWDESLVVVTSLYGEELGEEGRAGHGASLARANLEVPLLIKLPSAFEAEIVSPANQPVGLVRLWATLVEAGGGRVSPAVAPSLFSEAPTGVLTELYRSPEGDNRFAWIEDEHQLLRVVPFPAGAFDESPVFASPQVRERLLRWRPDGAAEEISDASRADLLGRRLELAWRRFAGPAASPAEVRKLPPWSRFSPPPDGIVEPSPGWGFWVHSSAVRASGS